MDNTLYITLVRNDQLILWYMEERKIRYGNHGDFHSFRNDKMCINISSDDLVAYHQG